MSYQGLLGREFEFEIISQEFFEMYLNALGFRLGSIEAKNEIVCVAEISQASVVWIKWVQTIEKSEPLAEGSESCL